MNNRLITVLLIIILVSTIAFNLHTLNRIDRLENSINNINHIYNSMENRLSNIDYAINNTLTKVEKEQQWIRNNSIELIEFIDYLPNRQEVIATIAIKFNEIKNDETLYLKVMGDDTEELIPLENYQDDLICEQTINLSAEENYEFTLIGETKEKTRSRELQPLRVKDIFNELVSIESRINRYAVDENQYFEEMDFHLVIEKNNAGYQIFDEYVKDLSIENAHAKIYIGEELIDTLDLIDGKDWEQLNIQNERNVQEEVVREHKEMGYYREVLLEISGRYKFKDKYKEGSNLKIVVEVEDQEGNHYTREMDVY